MPIVAAPALIAVAAALLALLLLYGIKYLVQALASLFPSNVPILSTIHNLFIAMGSAAMAVVQWIMADVIRPVINFVLAPVFAILNWLGNLETAVRVFSDQITWLISTGIPQLAKDLRALIASHVAALITRIGNLRDFVVSHVAAATAALAGKLLDHIHYVRDLALTGIAAAKALAHNLHDDLQSWATAAIAASAAALGDRIHQLRVDAMGAIAAVKATISSELSVAEGYTDTAVSDAIKAMQHATSVAVAGVIQTVDVDTVAPLAAAWPGVIDTVTGLEGVIGTDLPDIGAAIRAIPRAIPTDLTGAMAIVGAISIPMLRYMEQCGIPNCRNLSAFGRALQDLLAVVEGGAFVALLAELVADPIGMAHAVDDVLGPIARGAADSARSLLGV